MCKNEQKSQGVYKVLTYGDFRKRFTEEETRNMLKDLEIKGHKLSSEDIEKEINITYHNPDTDFSQDFLSYIRQKFLSNQDNNK